MIPWISLEIGIGIVFFTLMFCFLIFSFGLAFPNPWNWWALSKRAPAKGQAVSIPNLPSGTIPGRWYLCLDSKNPEPAVILICHGRSRGKGFVEPLAQALAASFSVLSFDFRNHGERGYGSCSMGPKESTDVEAALDYLKSKGQKRVGVVAISMGAAAASFAFQNGVPKEVRALAMVNPYASIPRLLESRRKNLHLPSFIKWPVLNIASILCGTNLSQIDIAHYLQDFSLPLSLFWGSHDQLTGHLHARELQKSLSFDRVERYEGGHDEPWNPDFQNKLLSWLTEVVT